MRASDPHVAPRGAIGGADPAPPARIRWRRIGVAIVVLLVAQSLLAFLSAFLWGAPAVTGPLETQADYLAADALIRTVRETLCAAAAFAVYVVFLRSLGARRALQVALVLIGDQLLDGLITGVASGHWLPGAPHPWVLARDALAAALALGLDWLIRRRSAVRRA